MPTVGQKDEVSNGWEEPSPESIRRRMEIDDGTAAWGDPGTFYCTLEGKGGCTKSNEIFYYFPGKYGGGSVNMWNGTAQTDQEALGSSSQRQSNPQHASKHPPQPMQPVAQDKGTGKICTLLILTSEDGTLMNK